MELEVDKLNFGETFEYGKTMLKELEETIEEFEAVNINPANFVNNYFSKLKSQVEVRRDKFKQKIDHHFDKLLNEIERHKTESEIAAKNFEYNPRKLEVGKDSLGKWIKQVFFFNLFFKVNIHRK
jgi:MinD-like ATPase involved in chromosome partitioning or flagellar assembly